MLYLAGVIIVPEAGLGSLGNGAFSLGRTHSQHRCSSLNFSPQQDLSSGVFVIAVRFFPQLLDFIKITYSGTRPGKRALKFERNNALSIFFLKAPGPGYDLFVVVHLGCQTGSWEKRYDSKPSWSWMEKLRALWVSIFLNCWLKVPSDFSLELVWPSSRVFVKFSREAGFE